MNDLVADWRGLAVDIRAAGVDIFNTGDIQRSAKGFADEKYLAMTLLVRTVSNMTGGDIPPGCKAHRRSPDHYPQRIRESLLGRRACGTGGSVCPPDAG